MVPVVGGGWRKRTRLSIFVLPADRKLSKGRHSVWVNEFGANRNWLGGEWLGGKYTPFNGILKFDYWPGSTNTKLVEIHLFAEKRSVLTVHFDEVTLIKK